MNNDFNGKFIIDDSSIKFITPECVKNYYNEFRNEFRKMLLRKKCYDVCELINITEDI